MRDSQDLDSTRTSHLFKNHDYKASCPDLPHHPNPIGLVPQTPHIGMTLRARILNGTIETKAPSPPKLVPQPSAINVKVQTLSYQLP